MSPFSAVVVSLPQVAQAFELSGQFNKVGHADSTSQLQQLLRNFGVPSQQIVFVFSDQTRVDTPAQLNTLIPHMVNKGAKVVIVGTRPEGEAMARALPQAGFVPGPLHVNALLGALTGFEISGVNPVAGHLNVELDLSATAGPFAVPEPAHSIPFGAPAAAVATQTPAAPAPFPVSQSAPFPTTPAPEPAAAPNPFATTDLPPAPAAAPFPAPVQDPQNPFAAQVPQPDTGGFPATPPNPFAAQTPPAPASSPNPFGGHEGTSTPGPLATPAADPFAAQAPGQFQAPANPFGATQTPGFSEGPAPIQAGFAPIAVSPAATPGFGQPAAGQAPYKPSLASAAVAGGGPRKHAKIIMVVAPKGGVGKSTLSLNLAVYLGMRLRGTGKTAALIDANIQQADIGKYLGAYQPNVEDLYRDPDAIHPDRILNYMLARDDFNLSVLLGPLDPLEANPLHYSGDRYAEMVEAMRPNFDYIIVDTPVAEFFHPMFRKFVIPKADSALVLTQPNQVTLDNAAAWLEATTSPSTPGASTLDPAKVSLVLNQAEPGAGLTAADVRASLPQYRFAGEVPAVVEWKQWANQNKVIATGNYTVLNQAFANVLYAATGDETFAVGDTDVAPTSSAGFMDKIARLFKKRG